MFRLRTALVAGAAFAALTTAEALAEPQILALVATDGAQPLTCADGECSGEFTSFCMEPGRASPYHATSYVAAETADLTLVATRADGSVTRLEAADRLAFASERGFTVVRVSLSRETLTELGAVRVGLEVGPRTALLPDTEPDANGRHSAEEIAEALGPNRRLGERIVDRGGPEIEAARLINTVYQELPKTTPVSAERRASLWRERSAIAALPKVSAEGESLAATAYERCAARVAGGALLSFRECLEKAHDLFVWRLTQAYWASVKRGF